MSTKYNEILRDINADTKEVIVANSQTNSFIRCFAINLNKCFIGENPLKISEIYFKDNWKAAGTLCPKGFQ